MTKKHRLCAESRRIFFTNRGPMRRRPINPLMGSLSDGSVLEVITTESGTWSMLLTSPKADIFLIAAGDHWQDIKQQDGETAL